MFVRVDGEVGSTAGGVSVVSVSECWLCLLEWAVKLVVQQEG
jgi:hypothetical protein